VTDTRQKRSACNAMGSTSLGKRPLGRRWKDNINVFYGEVRNWLDMIQDLSSGSV
jgi:hypothetical protein